MNRRHFLSLTALSAMASSRLTAAQSPSLVLPDATVVQTGGSKRIDIGGGHSVWTKKIGNGATKLLLLHGGPGADHRYFECFESFLPPNGIEIYYYDQLDSGNSDRPDDPKLWTIERFTQEVETVRKGLGLKDFYLLGHSWGGVLALEYALQYQQNLRGLIVSNMAASVASYLKWVQKLRSQFPAEIQSELSRYESEGKTEDPGYQKLLLEKVYKEFICRLDPWPDPLMRSLNGWNQHVYNTIQGRSEFEVTGTLKGWDRWKDLPRIQVRSLMLGARHDEMDPDDLRKMAKLMPKGSAWISERGSHFAMYDDQQNYFKALLNFLLT